MSAEDTWPPRAPWVGGWVIVVCVLVLAMILVGGATRLTDSGLSITEWNLEKGLTPPLSDARWSEEFALYQRTTEFQEQNYGMSIAEFQTIYWWEWSHRFLGKMLGVVFGLPFLFFLFTGQLRGRFRVMFTLFFLGALQGGVGWWMVTSGLFSGLDVSPIRLAIHLALAFTILALGVWVALGCFDWPEKTAKLGAPRWAPPVLLGLVFVQILFGALLAGSRGGAAYADWPTIGQEWIPASAFTLEPFFRNFIEEHATQHLIHRTLGYIVGFAALALAVLAGLRGQGAGRWIGMGIGGLAVLQAALGIATVVHGTPVWLGLVHQFGAAMLWMSAVFAIRTAR